MPRVKFQNLGRTRTELRKNFGISVKFLKFQNENFQALTKIFESQKKNFRMSKKFRNFQRKNCRPPPSKEKHFGTEKNFFKAQENFKRRRKNFGILEKLSKYQREKFQTLISKAKKKKFWKLEITWKNLSKIFGSSKKFPNPREEFTEARKNYFQTLRKNLKARKNFESLEKKFFRPKEIIRSLKKISEFGKNVEAQKKFPCKKNIY